MPRSLRYDEPYLLDERAASPIRHSGIRWGIGLVRFRRNPVVAARSGEGPFTMPFADRAYRVLPTGGFLSS